MPADRLLATLLRSFQARRNPQETSQLYATSASLLATLSNPLNLTLLTSQILTAPALWDRPDGLRTGLRVLGIFHSATLAILTPHPASSLDPPHALTPDEWLKAVVLGLDDSSPPARHLLALAGLLLALDTRPEPPSPLRPDIERGLVTATNRALDARPDRDALDAHCVALALTHTFPLLSPLDQRSINYDALLPLLSSTLFSSSEGFGSGYFLSAIDADVVPLSTGSGSDNKAQRFTWRPHSPSSLQLTQLSTQPLFKAMGPLSRLLAHALGAASNPLLVLATLSEAESFAACVLSQWRRNKLSEIDAADEPRWMAPEAVDETLPALWGVLKTVLFASVTVLRAVVGRVLLDRVLASDRHAPSIAQATLLTLRSLYFISSRLGINAFSATTFVSLAAIDILASYPPAAASAFLHAIRPVALGTIPAHPLDRCLDLFFLNTAEHFTLVVPPQVSEELLVAGAAPYLVASDHDVGGGGGGGEAGGLGKGRGETGGDEQLRSLFEAAHSVMLAVFEAPMNAEVTVRTVPFYIDALCEAFPRNLSPRQFRLAFRTLVRIASPPLPLAQIHPDLPSILLELVRHRALQASTSPLPPSSSSTPSSTSGPSRTATAAATASFLPFPPRSGPGAHTAAGSAQPDGLTEQAVLVLALLDSLPYLAYPHPSTLEEWLPLAAELVRDVRPERMAAVVRERFWEVLTGGEMDVERAAGCVAWWTRPGGGRDIVLGGGGGGVVDGRGEGEAMMHGALGGGDAQGESRL